MLFFSGSQYKILYMDVNFFFLSFMIDRHIDSI